MSLVLTAFAALMLFATVARGEVMGHFALEVEGAMAASVISGTADLANVRAPPVALVQQAMRATIMGTTLREVEVRAAGTGDIPIDGLLASGLAEALTRRCLLPQVAEGLLKVIDLGLQLAGVLALALAAALWIDPCLITTWG